MEYNKLPHPHVGLPTFAYLCRELNRLKKTRFAWMHESSKCAPQRALKDLDVAFQNFFQGRAHFPRFKNRKHGAGSFTLDGAIKIRPDGIRLPRIGWVRLKERGYLPSNTHINSATISERAGRWFVSINVTEETLVTTSIQGPVAGVDRGIDRLLMVSDDTSVENPRALKRYERKLKHLQKALSRKKKNSANRKKALLALRRLHYRIVSTRKDVISKATTILARTKSIIVVEDLGVKNMLGNHYLAESITDASMAEVVYQLEYKTIWYGSRLVKADRWYPSTKRCSRCGNVKKHMDLSERIYHCEACGLTIDRDLNAARNLEQWPGVARTLETPVEGGVQPFHAVQPLHEAGTKSLEGGPRP